MLRTIRRWQAASGHDSFAATAHAGQQHTYQNVASMPQVLTWWDKHSASAKDVVIEASGVVTPQAAGDDGATSHRLWGSGCCAQTAIANSPAGTLQQMQRHGVG